MAAKLRGGSLPTSSPSCPPVPSTAAAWQWPCSPTLPASTPLTPLHPALPPQCCLPSGLLHACPTAPQHSHPKSPPPLTLCPCPHCPPCPLSIAPASMPPRPPHFHPPMSTLHHPVSTVHAPYVHSPSPCVHTPIASAFMASSSGSGLGRPVWVGHESCRQDTWEPRVPV